MISNEIICCPINDRRKRFLYGRKGNSELLVIGLNPSTANESSMDPTSKNIESIASQNGFDGWWIINLYPGRYSKPKYLPKKPNKIYLKENLKIINKIIKNEDFKIKNVLLCWGNNVNRHDYLKNQMDIILKILKESNFSFSCIGITKLGNPLHPSPLSINRFLGGVNELKLKDFK